MNAKHQPMGIACKTGVLGVIQNMGWFGEPLAQGATHYVKSPPMASATSPYLIRISAARTIGEDHQNVIYVSDKITAWLYTSNVTELNENCTVPSLQMIVLLSEKVAMMHHCVQRTAVVMEPVLDIFHCLKGGVNVTMAGNHPLVN